MNMNRQLEVSDSEVRVMTFLFLTLESVVTSTLTLQATRPYSQQLSCVYCLGLLVTFLVHCSCNH